MWKNEIWAGNYQIWSNHDWIINFFYFVAKIIDKINNNDLVISNLVGDVLLGDGASDIFVGDGTNNVDIVFEQNGEIRDDGSGKNLTIGSKTTNVFVTGSSSLILQKQGGSVGLGTVTTDSLLHISGAAVSENLFHMFYALDY